MLETSPEPICYSSLSLCCFSARKEGGAFVGSSVDGADELGGPASLAMLSAAGARETGGLDGLDMAEVLLISS